MVAYHSPLNYCRTSIFVRQDLQKGQIHSSVRHGIGSCRDIIEHNVSSTIFASMDSSYLSSQVSTIIGQLHGLFDEIGVPSHDRESRESEVCCIQKARHIIN